MGWGWSLLNEREGHTDLVSFFSPNFGGGVQKLLFVCAEWRQNLILVQKNICDFIEP